MVLDPIVLTKFGDLMRFDPENKGADEDPVGTGTIWHNQNCYALVIAHGPKFYRVVCRGGCGTVLVVPNVVRTNGYLRRWCRDQIEEEILAEITIGRLVEGQREILAAGKQTVHDVVRQYLSRTK